LRHTTNVGWRPGSDRSTLARSRTQGDRMNAWNIKTALFSLSLVAAVVAAPVAAQPAPTGDPTSGQWHRSRGSIPIDGDRAILLKLDAHRLIWIGGEDDDPTNDRRVFIYDVHTESFREVASLPAAKRATDFAVDFSIAGVLADGSVVVAGEVITSHNDAPA